MNTHTCRTFTSAREAIECFNEVIEGSPCKLGEAVQASHLNHTLITYEPEPELSTYSFEIYTSDKELEVLLTTRNTISRLARSLRYRVRHLARGLERVKFPDCDLLAIHFSPGRVGVVVVLSEYKGITAVDVFISADTGPSKVY